MILKDSSRRPMESMIFPTLTKISEMKSVLSDILLKFQEVVRNAAMMIETSSLVNFCRLTNKLSGSGHLEEEKSVLTTVCVQESTEWAIDLETELF